MAKLYLICDESGSKGFAHNQETFEGEFGVFAGYLLKENDYDRLKRIFQDIYKKYELPGQKLHITDLAPEMQQKLREEVFELLKEEKLTCVYEAISVKGYNREYLKISEIKDKQREELKEKFTFSNNVERERLHSELFQALFGKAIAYFIDMFGGLPYIFVITDNIDNTLKKEFEIKARELINPFETPMQIKAFDKEKKAPVSKTVTFTSEILNDEISDTKFEITVEDNSLTLVADILANSILYYIKQSVSQNPNIILNSKEAIAGHPLTELFYGMSSEIISNFVSDQIYGRLGL